MADQVLRELEAAAHFFLAPPNLVTPEQRHSAEAVFINFRKTKSPYELCRSLLETSTVDYVLFEAACLIKSALVREWSMLPNEDIVSLRQYLFHYIISKTNLALFVRDRILQVIAIIVKRGSIENSGQERKLILDQVEDLIRSGDRPRQLLGCSIITALMQEYAITVKSSDVGLTWEVHFKAKQEFQVMELKRILKFSVGALAELTKDGIPEENFSLIKHLLAIAEDVLVWGFVYQPLPKRLVGVFEACYETDNIPTLRLNAPWADVILDPAIIELFFTLYWKVRTIPQLAHHARNCLGQLASLNGTVFGNDEQKVRYLTNYMQSFLKLVCNIDIIDHEALGIANIVRKIITFFRSTALRSFSKDLFRSFMEQMTRLTCLFAEGAAQEETMCTEDCMYMEAFDRMREAWMPILSETQFFPGELCKGSYTQIFNTYLKCHLSPPDGSRGVGGKNIDEEIDTIEEDDRTKFKEQLQTMGNFGREILTHSLTVLAKLLEDRTVKLREQLNRLAGQPASVNMTDTNVIKGLYEDLHWLVMMAGHLLCMECNGETAVVPSEIMTYSMEQARQGRMDVNVTLQLLASPQNNVSDINGAEDSADHVIRLIAAVFRLCEFEKNAIASNLTSVLSPELSTTIVWFLRRWSLSYFLPVEIHYSEISTTLLEAFGEDSPAALWTMNYLLEKVSCNINAFKSEPGLIKETIQLLVALVESRSKAACVLKSECLGRLIELATRSRYDLPNAAKKGLMRAIVQVGAAFRDESYAEQYWSQTLQPLHDQFKQIISNQNFPRSYHHDEVRVQLIDVFESFIGVIQGVQKNTARSVFRYTHPVLSELPNLLSFYHNYQEMVQLILEILCECARGMLWSQDDSIRMYESCLHTIQTYARFNTNRLTIDSTAEEDNYQDILLLMEILTDILSNDIYLIKHIETRDSGESLQPVDVYLYGLTVIMPLTTMNLLKFPSLCRQYFKMIILVCDYHPKKVCELPTELLQQLLASVELGLFSFSHDITALCCDIIQAMARYIYSEAENGGPKNQLMVPFLSLLINLILTHQINSDVMTNTSIPLYNLICCYQDHYQQIVRNLLSAQTDPEVAQRLAAAFTNLTENIQLNTEHGQKLKFRSNFDKFILNVQGFMMIK